MQALVQGTCRFKGQNPIDRVYQNEGAWNLLALDYLTHSVWLRATKIESRAISELGWITLSDWIGKYVERASARRRRINKSCHLDNVLRSDLSRKASIENVNIDFTRADLSKSAIDCLHGQRKWGINQIRSSCWKCETQERNCNVCFHYEKLGA